VLLLDALNLMRVSRHMHDPQCNCDCNIYDDSKEGDSSLVCCTKHATYKGITAFWQGCIYLKETGILFHNRACLLDKCGSSHGHEQIFGQPRKKISEVYKETTSQEFVVYLRPTL
jgi:hypothetical protein